MKEMVNNILKFDENGGMFVKGVENTVGKEEIARYEQFLHFSKGFQKDFHCRQVKPGFVWETGKRLRDYESTEFSNGVLLKHIQLLLVADSFSKSPFHGKSQWNQILLSILAASSPFLQFSLVHPNFIQ